jgi:hypothetical protein
MQKFGIQNYQILCSIAATALEHKSCRHPFYERALQASIL